MQSFKPQQAVSIRAACGVLGFDEPSVHPSRLNRLYLDQISVFPSLLGSYRGVRKRCPGCRLSCSMPCEHSWTQEFARYGGACCNELVNR